MVTESILFHLWVKYDLFLVPGPLFLSLFISLISCPGAVIVTAMLDINHESPKKEGRDMDVCFGLVYCLFQHLVSLF